MNLDDMTEDINHHFANGEGVIYALGPRGVPAVLILVPNSNLVPNVMMC